jgi:hypothetical protein
LFAHGRNSDLYLTPHLLFIFGCKKLNLLRSNYGSAQHNRLTRGKTMRNAWMDKMWKRAFLLAVMAGILAIVPFAGHLLAKAHPAPAEGSDGIAATTQKDQVDLAVTVYNSNLALIRDVRQLNLPIGSFPLRFEGVASSINPATVHIRSLSEPEKLGVLEQNYEYDLLDPQKLLQKYVGREVTLTRPIYSGKEVRWEEVKATLLADNNGPVWKIGGEILTGVSTNAYSFPELPENLYSVPTLVWSLDNKGAHAQRVEASYLTAGMNWNADYVLTVTRDEKSADIDGWVTLINNSGAPFKNAKLQLVAGDVNRVPAPYPAAMAGRMEQKSMVARDAAFAQESFSEYHLYSLERRTSIRNSESKQISLLNGTGIPVEKAFVVEGQQYYYRNPQSIGAPIKEPVQVFYRFKNEEKSGLGMPLPAGTVRVYQADSKGSLQFVGESNITHTPKDEKLDLHIGNAFDIVSERKQMDYRRISDRVSEMEYQITIRNHKTAPVTVEVKEPVGGDWEVLSSNYKWIKLDAFALGFNVPVAKDGTSVLTYRVRVHW